MTYIHTPVYSVNKPVGTEINGGSNNRRNMAHLICWHSLVMNEENACMLDFTQVGQADLSIRIVIDWD